MTVAEDMWAVTWPPLMVSAEEGTRLSASISGEKIKTATYGNDVGTSPGSRVGMPRLRVGKGGMIKKVGGTLPLE
jgi:hypothetical protein